MKRKLPCLAAIVFLCACTEKTPTRVEQPVKPQTANSLPPNVASAPSRPASPKEVDETLQRIFARVIIADRTDHNFVTGDFNGDGSPDLAVIVLPVKTELRTINDELANWTIQDAYQFFTPPIGQRVVFRQKQSRSSVEADEQLLAVVHGFGNEGWRDSAARQAYLVRHAAFGSLRAVPAVGHIENAPPSINKSDFIFESSNPGGFLFWNGSQYVWNKSVNNKR